MWSLVIGTILGLVYSYFPHRRHVRAEFVEEIFYFILERGKGSGVRRYEIDHVFGKTKWRRKQLSWAINKLEDDKLVEIEWPDPHDLAFYEVDKEKLITICPTLKALRLYRNPA